MKLHKKLMLIGLGLIVVGGIIFGINFAYMYDLVGKCIELSKCEPYPYWDIVNLGTMVMAASGLVIFIIGVALFFRHIDREDGAKETGAS